MRKRDSMKKSLRDWWLLALRISSKESTPKVMSWEPRVGVERK